MKCDNEKWIGDWVAYFAYGSNMNPERMWYRVPGARAVGVGVLKGWKVVERLYADIESERGAETVGVIYLMRWYDVERLDHFEGAPTTYARRMLPIRVGGVGGKVIRAITYVMTKETRAIRSGKPFPEDYRRVCSNGAKAFGIRDEYKKEEA